MVDGIIVGKSGTIPLRVPVLQERHYFRALTECSVTKALVSVHVKGVVN